VQAEYALAALATFAAEAEAGIPEDGDEVQPAAEEVTVDANWTCGRWTP
jgi:hypothetical protein